MNMYFIWNYFFNVRVSFRESQTRGLSMNVLHGTALSKSNIYLRVSGFKCKFLDKEWTVPNGDNLRVLTHPCPPAPFTNYLYLLILSFLVDLTLLLNIFKWPRVNMLQSEKALDTFEGVFVGQLWRVYIRSLSLPL